MEKSQSIQKIATALMIFQSKVQPIKKDGFNPHFKSNFASLDNVIDTVRPLLVECGLSYTQLPDGDEGLTTLIMHGESGEYIGSTYNIHAAKKDPQGIGSAITYARRYALCAALGLTTGLDDDGHAATGNNGNNGQQTAPQPTTDQVKKIRDAVTAISDIKTHAELLLFRDKQPDFIRNDSRFIAAGEGQWQKIVVDMAAKSKPVAA